MNEDRTLNYKEMIDEINEMIHAGISDPFGYLRKKFDPKDKQLPRNPHHPAFYCLVELKVELGAPEIDFDSDLPD